MSGKLEMHRHSFVSGKFSNGGGYRPDGQWQSSTFEHSHEGGGVPHVHPHTGPACYTIDKDEWARATGLRGGGRKTFTAKPNGEQMPYIAKAAEPFEVIIVGDPTPELGDGPGLAAAERIVQAFKTTYTIRDARSHRA